MRRIAIPAAVLLMYSIEGVITANELAGMAILGFPGGANWQNWGLFLVSSELYLSFAVWVMAVVQLYRAWRYRRSSPAVTLHGFSPVQFGVIGALSVALAVLGGGVAAWTAFAFWLTPWYDLP